MGKIIMLGLILLVVFLLGIFYFAFGMQAGVKLVGSEEFESVILDEKVFVLQAHVPYVGEIDGTDLVMEEWEDPSSYSDRLPQDKTAPIAIYCRSGRMSALTSQKLLEMGYKNVYELDGGMNAWVESGRELINEEK
jgi:rhodanese-related sulfurtransferase